MKSTLFLISPFYAYTIYKCVKIFYSSRLVNPIVEYIAYFIYAVAFTATYVYINNPFIIVGSNIALLFLLTSMYKGDIQRQITATTAITIAFLLTEFFFSLLSSYLHKRCPILSTVHEQELALIITRIVLFVFVIAAGRLKNTKNNISIPTPYWISLLAIPICTIIMLVSIFQANASYATLVVSGICAFMINCLTFLLYDQVSLSATRQMEQTLIEEQMAFYEKQFQTMKTSMDHIRLIRHDLKNRISPLYHLAKSQKYEELTEQLHALHSSYNPKQAFFNSGNDTIDSIVNLKCSAAKQFGVTMDIDVLIPTDLPLDAFDIAVLLGNLLDNAIEAAVNTTNKTISLSIKYAKGCLKFKVINSFDGIIIKNDGCFLSRKSNQMNHGLGLKSVEQIVEKYDGSLKIEYDDHTFSAVAMIYIDDAPNR